MGAPLGTPLVVTAHLDTPAVGVVEAPVMLDAPLSWAAAVLAQRDGSALPSMTRDMVMDMDLPLVRWEEHGTWGWCTSQAAVHVRSWTAVELRRKPATGPMARFTQDRRHHTGLGPHKARDTTVAAVLVDTMTWHVLATDRTRLESLLSVVTHVGKHANIGHGHVTRWVVQDDPNPDGWRDRPMPTPGATGAFRAPYWHPSRKVTVPA